MDGMRMLKSEPTELLIWSKLVERTDAALFQLQKRQADLIAASVSKLFKK